MTQAAVAINNPYWDEVKDHVGPDPFWSKRSVIDWLSDYSERGPQRRPLVGRYSWTITAPASVAFVADHARGSIVDPLAGTGYWAHVLRQAGVDVVAYDLHPPDGTDDNEYHKGQQTFVPVLRGDASDVVVVHADRTLLVSWPPMDPVAEDTLRAYTGDRLIYIGEGAGGCTADDGFFDLLDKEWAEVVEHTPIQWSGLHDYITVYDRVVAS